MVRIIKAAELPDSPTPPTRPDDGFIDVTHEVRRRLEQAQVEANRILDEARRQSRQIRHEAERLGQERGQAAFDDRVHQEVQRQLATVLPALQDAVKAVQTARTSHLRSIETGVIQLASAMAERLVRRELKQTPEITLDLVREALELATGSHQIRIHLNPADHQTLGARVSNIACMRGDGVAVEVIADADVNQGGCIVKTEFGTIDQQLKSQLARMMEELE